MLALYSNPKWLSVARAAVEGLTETPGFPVAQCRSITPAADESLTNIVRHSYGSRPDQTIALYFRRAQRRHDGRVQQKLEILLCDRGPAVDARKLQGRPLDEIRPAHWGRTSSVKRWTRWNSPAWVPRTACGWSSIWRRQTAFSEGEDTVHISARRNDKTTIFDLSGDIDFANSPKVRDSVLREIRESHTPRVIMNLSQVRYLDSSGVASLIEGLKASRDLGSRFILFGLSTSAREVLQLSRLIKVFEIYDSEEQAMAS
jgi:anti-sigma B factor antagonist